MALLPLATSLRGKPSDVGYTSSVSRKVLCCFKLYYNERYQYKTIIPLIYISPYLTQSLELIVSELRHLNYFKTYNHRV